MFSGREFVGLLLMASPVLSFPALMGGANQPFGHPSQAIFSPSGGNILYRSAAQVPQGQLIPANSELAAKATGGKGRCNVYYYCCIFYCWSKWTPCGCYLVCADSEQGGGQLIPVDQNTATTNEVFDPPSATVNFYQPSTPSSIFGQGGRADVEPDDHEDEDHAEDDTTYIEPPPMMMGGNGADKKVSSDDEREQVLTSDDIDQNQDVQYVTQPPSKQQDEEEADPNEIIAPEWEEHHTTRAPYNEPFVPIDEGEEEPFDGQNEEPPPAEPELPNEEQPYIEEEEFEEDTPSQFDDNQVGSDDGDDTLIAFGQVQGRRPLLVRFPQTGVAFEARARSSHRNLERRDLSMAKKEKGNKQEQFEGGKNNKNKQDRKKEKQNKKEEREERRRQRKKERKERKGQQQLQQQRLNNIDNKFIW